MRHAFARHHGSGALVGAGGHEGGRRVGAAEGLELRPSPLRLPGAVLLLRALGGRAGPVAAGAVGAACDASASAGAAATSADRSGRAGPVTATVHVPGRPG